ncbi:MAG: deoxyguanosinetriphosphate triphosphohydrolase [Candidatus Adiutrix sp.]
MKNQPSLPPTNFIGRLRTEEREKHFAPWAARSFSALRALPEEPCPFRSAFQRDRDRIIHIKEFRRLAYKTQVFVNSAGDHYRTRLTHTLEVSQISRALATSLDLNEDLTEAIALGHDLGHTPFGHCGEKVLNNLSPGGFTHQAQSLRIVDRLAKNGQGLNLTLAVRDGILKHSKGRGPIFAQGPKKPMTVEGQIVRVSDIVAYLAHDLDDAERASLITPQDLPPHLRKLFGDRVSTRIGAMVGDLLAHSSLPDGVLAFSPEMEVGLNDLRNFLYERVYLHPKVTECLTEAEYMVERVFKKLALDVDLLYKLYPATKQTADSEGVLRAVTDVISGMTDRYILKLYRDLFWAERKLF